MRLRHLDAVRGIAAFVIVFHHCFYSFRGIAFNEILKRVFGGVPVIIFFILSGFVLCESLGKKQINLASTTNFYIRRLFRIYPAIIVTLVGAAVIARIIVVPNPELPAGELFVWFVRCAKNVHSLKDYFNALFLHNFLLDNPLWTIKVELWGSLFIPIFIFIRRSKILIILIGITLAITNQGAPHINLNDNLWCFYLGFLIYYFRSYGEKVSKKTTQTLLPVSLVLSITSALYLGNYLVTAFFCGIFLYILVPCNWSNLNALLNKSIMQILGNISYGIYLIHYPILFLSWTFAISMVPNVLLIHPSIIPAGLIFLFCFFVTLPLAMILFYLVEKPTNGIGHRYFK